MRIVSATVLGIAIVGALFALASIRPSESCAMVVVALCVAGPLALGAILGWKAKT